jgi:hypothetical protein
VYVKQPGAITPKLPALTTQILVIVPTQIGHGKVALGVFVKQPGVINPKLPALTTQILVVAQLGSDRGRSLPVCSPNNPM